MTYLEFLHRLQLRFICDSRPMFHLCDIAVAMLLADDTLRQHVLRFKQAVSSIIKSNGQYNYSVEDHLGLQPSYSIYYHTLYPSAYWQACVPAYYFRLKILNDFIKEEESNVQNYS